MDDLQFRRAIYADPKCTDEAVVCAAKDDPKKQAFWNELKHLDKEIEAAARVEVPADLAHKLLLKQSFSDRQHSKKRKQIWFGLAATIAVAFSFSLTYKLSQQPGARNLGDYAMAHVQEEGDGYALRENGDITVEAVNAKLASLGAHLNGKIGRIYYANFCNFDGIRSFHMVMESEQGKVTVFVIPQTDHLKLVDDFANEQLVGQRIAAQHANIVVVSDKGMPIEQFKYKLKKTLMFTA